MVWCGVVWCGVVWCGVVWCSVVWCGAIDIGNFGHADVLSTFGGSKKKRGGGI